jgi:CubicO group peptidase (beta-lactamase class C family)
VDANGFNIGAMGLHLTLRDMTRFGFLYLNQGRWEDEQLILPDYVEESVRAHSNGGPPVGAPYGLMWWLPNRPVRHYAAVGFGGQVILVIPELDLVVAITTSMRGHPAQILGLFVLPAVQVP